MSDAPFGPDRYERRPAPANEPTAPQPNGSGNWLPRWRGLGTDTSDPPSEAPDGPAAFSPIQQPPHPPAASPPTPQLRETGSSTTHLHGDVDVVAGVIDQLILETRKRDLLEGVEISRRRLLDQPLVHSAHWDTIREQAISPETGRLHQPVLIIVAPRSYVSTTFALRLLAEQASGQTTVVKLDADWSTPSKGRLPLEKNRAYQLDLKHPENDQLSVDFLDALSTHAANLRDCGSYLVLTVAQELWRDHRLSSRDGVHVVRLNEAPDAQQVIEAHLKAHGYAQLVASLQSFPKAKASLRGLTAVSAVRAAHTLVMAWQEHTHLQQSPARPGSEGAGQMSLEARVIAALTDWRGELDDLFGEVTNRYSPDNPSLTVEDRCLLLALAVRQSAPMPDVARSASGLLEAIGNVSGSPGAAPASSPVPNALAGRGLRRRIQDVGARVDAQDSVVFDRPSYGRAVLEYVWDNYDVMREPLLTWLVETAQSADLKDRALGALAELTVRHGTMDYLTMLGKISSSSQPEVLSAVMESAVRNEHIGRLAWEALYRWAEQDEYALTVIALCRHILEDTSVTAAMAKRAMVRLRRVAHKTHDPTVRSKVLVAFTEIAQRPTGTTRLAAEVRDWQQNKVSARGGSLAFLALLSADSDGTPWLLTAAPPDIDVQRAVRDLLNNPATATEIIPRLTDMIRTCAATPDAYAQLRDRLLPALRGHNMFEAGMNLMHQLRGISTTEGVSVADDFYHHLVDGRLQSVFPLKGDAA
jgi:hypothetical protein